MTAVGWAQIVLFFLVVLALTRPLGAYMFRIFEGAPLWPRLERAVTAGEEQSWSAYALSLLLFSLFGMLVTWAIQRLQHVLPFNPQHLPAVEPALAFNTAASFTSNTFFPYASNGDLACVVFRSACIRAIGCGIPRCPNV